jgi:predicted glycogen debranching enzyme
MAMYSIETHGQLRPYLEREWLLTNGLGSFASSTIVGCNTRRYHGLLCAATLPPVGRIMALNRIGEMVVADGTLRELAVNQFNHTFHPHGEQFLQSFELDGGVARWRYDVAGVRVMKEVQLAWMQNRIAVRYTIEPPTGKSAQLRLQPFVSLRDFHSLVHDEVRFDVRPGDRSVTVSRDGQSLHLRADAGTFEPKEEWWHNHTYAIESDRGLDDSEHLFAPGQFVAEVSKRTVLTLWAGTEAIPDGVTWEGALARRPDPCAPARETRRIAKPTPPVSKLLNAAADFIVARKSPDGSDGTTILAGYPWFADWGRDTMISLPGLLLVSGRYAAARQVLSLFSQYVSQGMIPNKFDDYNNEPHYNTVDASLWFIHAAFEYLKASGDRKTFDAVLLPACRKIVDGYSNGTRFGIRMDPADGLITQGDAQTQLTWMDAKCGDTAFTPRQGKPVEINALWYHALVLMGDKDLATKVGASFRDQFWISPFRGLADVVHDGQKDQSIRPNQIFAVSLENSPLTPEQQHAVVEVVRRELLTPYGLRSLARSDPKYQAIYKGNQWCRDSAYHNGTVWSWPIGAFVEAHLRVNKNSPEAIAQGKAWLAPLIDAMDRDAACIGQISEIYEAESPFRAVGCCAQAWSVAEVLRLAVQLGL